MADTKLADRTAGSDKNRQPTTDEQPSPSVSTRSLRPSTPKTRGSPAPADTASPSNLAQIRAELASTQKIRSELEAKLSQVTSELSALKTTSVEQRKRIIQLEAVKQQLDRRMKDRTEELKGKGKFVEDVQDEMVALNLQLNMAEQEKERLKKENEELTRRWVEKMEDEARKMNAQMGWEDKRRK